jgi:dihydroneopterin aldolase
MFPMTFDRSPAARPAASSAIEELRPGIYRVYVRDFILPANIGVHDSERNGPQRVRINVDLHVVEGDAPLDDDISKVYSYEKVVNGVRDIIAGGHINLVETLAERIALLCFEDARVTRARVAVDKLDVEPDADALGIEIERTR